MTALMKSVWAVVGVLLFASCVYSDSDRVYSSYECSSVEGADPNDLTARTCVLHNVCIDRTEHGEAVWSYFLDPEKPDDIPLLQSNSESGEVVSLSYRRNLNMLVDIVRNRPYSPKNVVDSSRVTALFCTPTNNYAHFVLDGMFGLHWLLTKYGYADEETGEIKSRSAVDVLDVCRQSKIEKNLHGLFTDTTPGSAISLFP